MPYKGAFRPLKNILKFSLGKGESRRGKGGERRGVGSVVNLVRGFPSHCGKPIGFSIVAALFNAPAARGKRGR